ncbi:PAS domain-containing protein [Streptomyces cyaneogriseus]|uniref:PAS domain-containing protein n=1 Tax=Streptomyces cyaneogriseus TaxID=68192 RepID=UPI00099DB2A1|nr:PAS domain-containing protein [Streptomyces cyaneogriseus]
MSSRPSRGAARLAAILDALPDALVLVNANGTVVNANTIALETFETPGTALVGRGLLDLLPQFDSKLIPGSMRRPDHLDPRARTKPTRMIARRTDGTEFPVEVTSANLENGQQAYDGYGYTGDELLMLVVRDLSGTVDTEAELARSQRQTEMILRAASEGVVGTDTDGRIVLVNPAAAQILGYRAGELGGRELHTLILHSRADGSPFPYDESPLADTLRSGRKHRVRGQVVYAKNGDKVPVDLTTAPVRDGDQLVGAVMTFADRRPYEALVKEREDAERRHAEELERVAEEHASELTALRQKHVTEVEELREKHAEELAAGEERYAALGEREKDRYEALAARHEQLLTLLGVSLRGPLEELRRELSALAADDAGQLWPEANQVLHHLSAGYSRITTLIDNVLGYQRLDTGAEGLSRTKVMLDAVVTAGVDGAVELVGPGRVQFAVHAPPIEAEVDPRLLATALAHLVADVAGVDATGNAPVSATGYMDSTVVVAAAQRGEVVRIEVRGPYAGGDPVHEPIVRGIVRAHGGVLQTHEVPGMSGSAYVLEVPIGAGAGAVAAGTGPAAEDAAPGAAPETGAEPGPAGEPAEGAARPALAPPAPAAEAGGAGERTGGGRRRARRVDAFLESDLVAPGGDTDGSGVPGAEGEGAVPTGRRRRRAAEAPAPVPAPAAPLPGEVPGGTGRRRRRPSDDAAAAAGQASGVAEGAVVTAAEHAAGTAASGTGLGGTVPPQGVPAPSGRRARHPADEQHALPPALPAPSGEADPSAPDDPSRPTGRRRRALASAAERAAAQEAGPRQVFALPPAEADRPAGAAGGVRPTETPAAPATPAAPGAGVPQAPRMPQAPQSPRGPVPVGAEGPAVPEPSASAAAPGADIPAQARGHRPAHGTDAAGTAGAMPSGAGASGDGEAGEGRHDAVPHDQSAGHTAPQPHPVTDSTGRRRRPVAVPPGAPVPAVPPAGTQGQGVAVPAQGVPVQDTAGRGVPVAAQGGPAARATARTPGEIPGQAPAPIPGQAQGRVPGQIPAPVPASAPASVPSSVPATAAVPGRTPEQAAEAPSAGQAQPQGGSAPTASNAPIATGQAGHAAGQTGHIGQIGQTGHQAGVPAPQSGTIAQPLPQPQAAPRPPQQAPDEAVAGPPGPAAQAVPAPQPWPVAGETPAPGTPVPPDGAANAVPAHGTAAPVPPGDVPEESRAAGAAAPVPPAAPAPAPGAPLPGTAPLPPESPRPAQPLPAEAAVPVDPHSTQGRSISVRTLGQGVPFTRQAAQVQQPSATPAPHQPGGSGRRRKLGTPPDPAAARPEQGARPHPAAEQPRTPGQPQPGAPAPTGQPPRLAQASEGAGRSYAIGAPDENAAEGPEPLDGPGGAVEVADTPRPQPLDDELPPEPLDNPRRLLVWPAPDVSTQQALSDRGYRPVIVHSREEVDAQIAAFPAALFVDPLTGPITRTALQSLRQAAVAAEVPVLVTAGLGQASRDAAYGADPAVLLKALAPRDSEQHPPRVLLIEEHPEIALALTATLERRGMHVARAASDADAVALATQFRPNLVVMDLMRVHRRQAGIVDWLRANGQLNRTPLVVYTAAVDPADLPRLASGETVLFLAERSTSTEVQSRIVDLLARIGTN